MLHRIKWDEQTSNTKGDGELGLEGIKWESVGGGGIVLSALFHPLKCSSVREFQTDLLDFVLLCFCETRSLCIALADLSPKIHLPLLSEHWD